MSGRFLFYRQTLVRLLRRGAKLETRDDLGRAPEMAAAEIYDPDETVSKLMNVLDRFMRENPDARLYSPAPTPAPSIEELPEVDPDDPLRNLFSGS